MIISDFSGLTHLDIIAANGMVTGTSVKGSILPGDLGNQEAVHFGDVPLKDTNALPTLKSSTYQIITCGYISIREHVSYTTAKMPKHSLLLYP